MQFIYARASALDNDYAFIDLGPEALLIERCFAERRDVEFIDIVGSVTNLHHALDTAHDLGFLHFSAHGNPRGIVLEDSTGSSHVLSAAELRSFVHVAPLAYSYLLLVKACLSLVR